MKIVAAASLIMMMTSAVLADPRDDLAERRRLTIEAAKATDAARPKELQRITIKEFLGLFTASEQSTLLSSIDPKVRLLLLTATANVRLSDPEVVDGVNYLATVGIINNSRVADILSRKMP